MTEEKKDVETLEGQGAEEQNKQTQPEKKYTDEEVNNISVKNSKKAVAKLMNILYECKKATGLLQKAGLQLPSVLFLTDGYIHSIRDFDSSVKPKFENATKRL
ncbi:MAG: hypothetical protein UEY93_01425 [Acutalibacteraceae bacterium]|nr:hypothetical protein [Acutalibacteraceae bacterium]